MFARHPSVRLVAAAGVGAAASLSQAPASIWPLAGGAIVAAVLLLATCRSARAAAGVGWALGFGYFLPGLLWIGEAFLVDAEVFAWMRPFAVTLLPAGLALFWAAAFYAARRIAPNGAPPLLLAAALTLCWFGAEVARGHVLTGFPWGLFAYAFVETPLAQIAAYVGPYGLTGLVLWAFAALAAGILGGWRSGAASGVGLLALAAIVGAARLGPTPTPTPADGDAPVVRLVQPNVPQREKWVPEHRQRNFDWLMILSQGPTDEPIDLVVWPETAVPFAIDRADGIRPGMMAQMPGDARLVLGSLRGGPRRLGGDGVYNSLFVIDPAGGVEAVYDKHHLVPFGEFLPFQSWLQALGVRQLAGELEGFSAGPGPRTIRPASGPSFSALICYEAVFPTERTPLADRPDMILQVTNDAWFGDSGGPWQHLVQARFRAIEQGLPFLRSANTGVTAAIDPYGRVLDALSLGERGAIDVRVPAALPPPPYARWGEALWLPGAALLLGVIVALWRRHT